MYGEEMGKKNKPVDGETKEAEEEEKKMKRRGTRSKPCGCTSVDLH